MTQRRCRGVDNRTCGRLVTTTRCPDCARIVDRVQTRAKRVRRPYPEAERQRRAATVRAWVAEHGPLCPGWRRPTHLVEPTDLTADHPHAVAAGGAEGQPLAVLCRSCNSSKRDHSE